MLMPAVYLIMELLKDIWVVSSYLAITNKALINIQVCMTLGVQLLRCLSSWEIAKQFFQRLSHFSLTPSTGEWSQFIHIYASIGIAGVFHLSSSDRCVVTSHCGFGLHPQWLMYWASSHVLPGHLVVLLDECLLVSVAHFLTGLLLSLLSGENSWYILNTRLLPDMWFRNVFFLFFLK